MPTSDGPANHIYQVAMNPQLAQLTNTLKKKKTCNGGHPGPCHHTMARTFPEAIPEMSSHSDHVTQNVNTLETELIPESSDVVFRAVSPHGHVYWEIDPKRPDKLARPDGHSDEDTNNDMHNMSDFSEDDGRLASDRSRQSSSRFSDNRPLISSTNTSPGHVSGMGTPAHSSINGRSPVPGTIGRVHGLPQVSPSRTDMRFSSLRMARSPVPGPQTAAFSTRTRLGNSNRHPRLRDTPSVDDQVDHNGHIPEQLQQQVQIRDLQRMPVSVKSSEYIMHKIQTHMDQRNNQPRHGGRSQELSSHKEREV